jgi:D-xylose transport system permease protein
LLAATELDTRLLGMVVAIAVIWITFNILSNGDFLTSRWMPTSVRRLP